MDTVEARDRAPSPPTAYDGFISYSHAADDLLAPRLQAGLQKFAKPWWKRRAVRIFRDESSLSANPHLWSSITGALDASEWFIPLLSPEAARSEWVNREIEYWLEHRDATKVVPVITEGDFAWSGTDIDPASTAAPPALYGAFAEEPRWVDLRFARTEEQLDLSNPQFSAAIADIASTIRGIEKDELASEEVRQHRRTVRTAWGAGIALFVLALLAGGAALYANAQRNEADDQRAAAEASADAEAAAAAEAEAQRAEAEANADLARSRELAASAVGVADRDPELSLLLTMAAFDVAPEGAEFPEGIIALREALAEHNLIARYTVGNDVTDVALSADGSRLVALSASKRGVTMFDTASGEPIWEYVDTATVDQYWQVALSPDESTVIAIVPNWRIVGDFSELGIGEGEQDELPARLVVLSASDGSVIRTVPFEQCDSVSRIGPLFSPDGQFIQLSVGEPCDSGDPANELAVIYDANTFDEIARFAPGGFLPSVAFAGDMSLIAVRADDVPTEVLTWPDLEPVHEFKPAHTVALSPDGSLIAIAAANGGRPGTDFDRRPHLYDTASGDLVDVLSRAEDFHTAGLLFSSDGSQLFLGTGGADLVWDVETGELTNSLNSGATEGLSATADGSLLATARQTGEILLWDLAPAATDRQLTLEAAAPLWINPNEILAGDPVGITVLAMLDDGSEEGVFAQVLTLVDPTTGAVLDQLTVRRSARLADGRFVVLQQSPIDATVGPLSVWDPSQESIEIMAGCVLADDLLSYFEEAACPDGTPFYGDSLTVGQDGSTIAAGAYHPFDTPGLIAFGNEAGLATAGAIDVDEDLTTFWSLTDEWLLSAEAAGGARVIDPSTGDVIAIPAEGEWWRPPGQATADGRSIFLTSQNTPGLVYMFDTQTWQGESWRAHEEAVRGFALSPDGSMLATTGEDDFVKIWSLPDRILLDKIPADFPSDAMWIDDSTMGIALADGARWAVVTLDVDQLLARARDAVTRSFTAEECTLYAIDPCPTLAQIRDR